MSQTHHAEPAADAPLIIDVQGLTKSFGETKVVDGIDMQVADVVPTLLSCEGAPSAKDFDGQVVPICGDDVAFVDTYLGTAGGGGVIVDDSQEDQIKALGYMDD